MKTWLTLISFKNRIRVRVWVRVRVRVRASVRVKPYFDAKTYLKRKFLKKFPIRLEMLTI